MAMANSNTTVTFNHREVLALTRLLNAEVDRLNQLATGNAGTTWQLQTERLLGLRKRLVQGDPSVRLSRWDHPGGHRCGRLDRPPQATFHCIGRRTDGRD